MAWLVRVRISSHNAPIVLFPGSIVLQDIAMFELGGIPAHRCGYRRELSSANLANRNQWQEGSGEIKGGPSK